MFLLFMKNDPDNFDHLLHSWNEVPAPSGRLASPVWQRIEAVGRHAGWFGGIIMALRELDARFARPQAIAAVVALSLLVGFGVAELRARYDARQTDTEMSARYLSMLDLNGR
jgi:hypothetical protein